jgi:hypothetical protein
MTTCVFRKIVLSLGALHLTLMAVIGIWFWSSPALFESRQPERLPPELLDCTSITLLGQPINVTSSPLRVVSLVLYAVFALPGLNLLIPAAALLALHIGYHRITNRDHDAEPSVKPVYIALIFLLAVNILFMIDIETTITLHDVSDESKWTFGQTLAVLLLILPIRDVVGFITHVRNRRRRARYTTWLTDALEDDYGMDELKIAVKYADIRTEAPGKLLILSAIEYG